MTREPIGLAPGAASEAAGQDARKYASSNKVVRWLLDRWFERLRACTRGSVRVLADIGTGEGICLERLEVDAEQSIGVDFRHDKLRSARRRLPDIVAIRADAGMLPLRNASVDLVLCIEVLEHLTQPDRAIEELARVTDGQCLVSVPWEPFFRLGNLARGKNLARWGNDPEHVAWFTTRRLHLALSRCFDEVTIQRSFPWLLGVARSPRRGR